MAGIGANFWLTQWNWSPSVLLGTAIIVGLYLYAVGPLRRKHGRVVARGQVFAFLLGVTLMFLALVSPLDELGDSYLFSAHMVQHLILTIIGPPLLLIGIPAWMAQPLLRNTTLLCAARFLTLPIVAFFLFNGDFWLWHLPALYDATLENEAIHVFEHLTFIGFALLFWWPIFSPLEEGLPRLPLGGQILYLFMAGMPMVALGAGLTFAPPLYAPYLAAPRVWGLSPVADQQLGGLIMWVPGNLFFIVIVSVLFIRWMLRQDEKQREHEAQLDEAENNQVGVM